MAAASALLAFAPAAHARNATIELEIYKAQARETGKPENGLAKIAEGKLAKWYEQVVLLEQPFVKEPEKTVETLRRELVGRIGENIEIARFARFRVGERGD